MRKLCFFYNGYELYLVWSRMQCNYVMFEYGKLQQHWRQPLLIEQVVDFSCIVEP
jgi:hypothetical protein